MSQKKWNTTRWKNGLRKFSLLLLFQYSKVLMFHHVLKWPQFKILVRMDLSGEIFIFEITRLNFLYVKDHQIRKIKCVWKSVQRSFIKKILVLLRFRIYFQNVKEKLETSRLSNIFQQGISHILCTTPAQQIKHQNAFLEIDYIFHDVCSVLHQHITVQLMQSKYSGQFSQYIQRTFATGIDQNGGTGASKKK